MVSAVRGAFAPGDQVGAYTIIKQIGSGGMGEVFEALHRHIGRGAAIKVLLPELSVVEAAVTRLFNEARAASLIKHPGIVEILDCDIHPPTGRAYIVMELLQGENLGTCLRRVGSFKANPRWVAAVTGQIAGALAAAHGKGITHRDLKPDNIFLVSMPDASAPITVKVLDFGVAKLFAKGTGVVTTGAGTILGTPHYMSPEQCRGVERVDHRADIYSLGCMMFELISGGPPFVGEGAGDLLVAHISKAPPDLAALAPGISSRMNELVGWMLAKDPDHRPQRMEQVVSCLEAELAVTAASFSTLILPPDDLPADVWTKTRLGIGVNTESLPSGSPDELTGPGGTRILTVPGPTTLENAASGSRTTTRVRRRKTVVAGLALGIGFGAVVFLAFRGSEKLSPTVSNSDPGGTFESQAAPRMSPPEPARAASGPSPSSLTAAVDLSSNPSGAEVWVPGESTPRGLTPVVLLLPRGGTPKQVVLKAPGYQPKTVSLVVAHDSFLAVQLDKVKTERKAPSSHRGKAAQDYYAPMPD